MNDLLQLAPEAFVAWLARENITRFWLVPDEAGRVTVSDERLEPLAAWLNTDDRDVDAHEGVFVSLGPETGTLLGAFIHRTARGQAAGGVRNWTYASVLDFLRDGLRLAKGMTQKNALAGLWWGGGKGIIARGSGGPADPTADREPARRRKIYEEYGSFITSLRGCYVTAEDVGTNVDDMAAIFSRTRYTTCIPHELGGSGNPSAPTARGVVCGMRAALTHLGRGTLEGKTVAIQGLGHVGEALVGYLRDESVGRIVASDIDPEREARVRELVPDVELDVRIVPRDDLSIFAEPADILSPNATGAVLNERTIPTIAAPIVCGAANNQLEDPETDDERLRERGILYLPDFLVNRMGIVHCADEAYGSVDDDPLLERHLGDDWDNSIHNLSLRVLVDADRTDRTPHRVAVDLADIRALDEHPITGHRGREIIRGLAQGGWARSD